MGGLREDCLKNTLVLLLNTKPWWRPLRPFLSNLLAICGKGAAFALREDCLKNILILLLQIQITRLKISMAASFIAYFSPGPGLGEKESGRF
jgi:hypothetical protein